MRPGGVLTPAKGVYRNGYTSVPADNIDGLSSAVSIEPEGLAAAAAVPSIQTTETVQSALPARRTRWWVEALAIGWLLWVYDAINNLAPLRLSTALAHSRSILSLEQSLGIDPEHALDRWLAGQHTLGVLLSDYYDNAHFIVTLSLLGWLWWRRADLYRPLRNALLLVNLLAFVVFWLYPVAPPRMLPGFTDVVAATHAFGSWHTGALASQANELAAMPSLHIAWALWCTVALWRLSRRVWVRLAAALYPCLTAAAVLATGNHFVLDMVGGVIDIAVALAIVRLFRGRLSRPRAALGRVARKPQFLAKSDNLA
jgi:PAP2 superfamily